MVWFGYLTKAKIIHQVAEGDQFLPEWSNPTGTLLDKEVAIVNADVKKLKYFQKIAWPNA